MFRLVKKSISPVKGTSKTSVSEQQTTTQQPGMLVWTISETKIANSTVKTSSYFEIEILIKNIRRNSMKNISFIQKKK